jgi:hypothetical protein
MVSLEELVVHLEDSVERAESDDWCALSLSVADAKLLLPSIRSALSNTMELGTTPNNTSVKLPSSTEVWNHVCEYSPALRTVEQIEADRRVAKLVYEFIRRQLHTS